MSIPVMTCSRCGAAFDWRGQFCAGCGNNLSLQRALCDFEYGDFDARVNGACAVAGTDKALWQQLAPEVELFLVNLTPHLALSAAVKLQIGGAMHPRVTGILLENLAKYPDVGFSYDEFLSAVSTMRDNAEAITLLKRLTQAGKHRIAAELSTLVTRFFCALGAIGNPETRPFLEYWAIRRESGAIAALQCFGTAPYQHIVRLSEQLPGGKP